MPTSLIDSVTAEAGTPTALARVLVRAGNPKVALLNAELEPHRRKEPETTALVMDEDEELGARDTQGKPNE